MTRDEKAGATVLGIGAVILGLLFFSRRAKAAPSPSPSASPDRAGGQPRRGPVGDLYPDDLSVPDYIRALWARWEAEGDQARQWTTDRLKLYTRLIAFALDQPPEIIWGLMWDESRGQAVGVFGNSLETALPNATEYGVSQITLPRWNAEASSGAVPLGMAHIDLIWPELAIIATAYSLDRYYRKFGAFESGANQFGRGVTIDHQSIPDSLAAWWPNPGDYSLGGTGRKRAAMMAEGPNVWLRADGSPLEFSDYGDDWAVNWSDGLPPDEWIPFIFESASAERPALNLASPWTRLARLGRAIGPGIN